MTHASWDKAALLTFTLLLVGLSQCGCGTVDRYARRDDDKPEPYYIIEVTDEGTPNQKIRLVCTSKTRTPTPTCNKETP